MRRRIPYLLFILLLSTYYVHSQELFIKELQWQEKNEYTKSLYQSMENFINEEAYVKLKRPSISEGTIFDYFGRKKIEKEYAEQKRVEQQKAKKFIDTHFIICDSIIELIFYDKDQIIEWSKNRLPFAYVHSEDFFIRGCNIYIVRTDGCSGVHCWNIDVFKEKDGLWQLITGTYGILRENITINIDDLNEKILFETTYNRVISELPFKWLLDSY